MKKFLLMSLAFVFAMATTAQNVKIKTGVQSAKPITGQKIAIEPVSNPSGNVTVKPQPSGLKNAKGSKDFVNVITIGTSANAYGYGYTGGQKTMVWADDNLNALINVHRMGPGSAPPSLSGYLAADLGVNLGQSEDDWTQNRQIYAATLPGAEYYLDAARYPQGGIYNPAGNMDLENAYAVYFAPNLSNLISTWGGYSYGTCNLVNQGDSVKDLYWYAPPIYSYTPDGFTITQNGNAFYTDIDQNWESGSVVYMGNIIMGRGVFNNETHGFDYTQSLLPLVTKDNERPSNERIAASPDGNVVWVVTIANNGHAVQIGDFANLYPILFKSIDGGLTWSDPIAVQLDGPDGIEGVKYYMSNFTISQWFEPPLPTRDEIPYTTAFDCDLSVDKWGNPHIGVIIGVPTADYSIMNEDSTYAVFDIYTTDDGATWNGVAMGYPWTFRGTFGDLTEDNRVNIASTQTGDKIFVTWDDTQMAGVDDNSMPDVFARGFDLITNRITSAWDGNQPDNVSLISDVSSQAWFQCTSHYVFTDNNKYTLPIVTEFLSVPTNPAASVEFKYLCDFAYENSDFTIPVANPPFPVGTEEKSIDLNTMIVSPNPVKETASVILHLNQGATVFIVVSNLVGQQVLSYDKGMVASGTKQYTLDASALPSGVYLVTAWINDQKITKKMIVQ